MPMVLALLLLGACAPSSSPVPDPAVPGPVEPTPVTPTEPTAPTEPEAPVVDSEDPEAGMQHTCTTAEDCSEGTMCTGTPQGRACVVPPPFVPAAMATGAVGGPPRGPQFPAPERPMPRSAQ